MALQNISPGDIVDVILPDGGVLNNYLVLNVPGNTEVYWELENPVLSRVEIVGPTITTIVKKG